MKYDLYFGDCLKVMEDLIQQDIKIDAVISDLPYNKTNLKWDKLIPFNQMWDSFNRLVSKNTPIVLFGNEPFSSALRLSNIQYYKYDIYWEKERLVNINQVKNRVGKTVENIVVFYNKQCYYNPQMQIYNGPPRSNKVKNGTMGVLCDGNKPKKVREYKDDGLRYPTDVWKFKRDILTSNIHDTQKPVVLMEKLVKTYTKENETILDITCGSGSTGVACRNLNRNFIGIDNDICEKDNQFKGWKWIDVTKWRIENE